MESEPSNVVAYRSPRAEEEHTQYLGMVVFLCGWAMLFCGLFLAYGVIRSAAASWPPANLPRLPIALASVNTALVLVASVCQHLALQSLRAGRKARAIQALMLALSLGALFLAIQAAIWTDLIARGMTLDSGPYADLFFVLTGFHALHVVVGEGGLLYVMVQVWRGLFNAAYVQPVRLWAMYGNAVAAAWCLTFLAVYVA